MSVLVALLFLTVMIRASVLFENIDSKISYLIGIVIGIVYGIILHI